MMEKVLSQGGIDALFRAAGVSAANNAAGAVVEPWNIHQACLLDKDQLRSISQLHESFARNLTTAAASYLSDKFEVALVAVEQLACQDFLARFSDATYYGTFRLPPNEASGILHMDLSVAFPIIDLLLGGPGRLPESTREVTEIEEMLLEGFGHVICHELQEVWQRLGLRVEFEQRLPALQLLRTMPPQEKTLTLTFDVTMTDSKGMLNIAIPSVVSTVMMRKLRAEMAFQRARGQPVNRESIGNRLLKSLVRLELTTPDVPVRVMNLLGLEAGTVLPLRRRIEEPAMLRISGRDGWLAHPVDSHNRRAAQVVGAMVQAEEKE